MGAAPAEGQIDLRQRRLPSALTNEESFFGSKVVRDLDGFKQDCDVIIANRMTDAITDVKEKVFTRDLYGSD
ncbi:hypothetical protein OSJ57_19195 [Sphingomonas sp. HH69]